MTATSVVFRNDQLCSRFLPTVDDSNYDFRTDSRVVSQCDEHGPGFSRELFSTTGNRSAHLAFRIRIEGEAEIQVLQVCSYQVGLVAHHHDNGFDASLAEVVDAGLNHRFVAEREQGFEGAHALGATSGQENRGNGIHTKSGVGRPKSGRLKSGVGVWMESKSNCA